MNALILLAVGALVLATTAHAQPGYRVLGQPSLAGTTRGSRCADANARFNFLNDDGFKMYGPSGIAVDPRGRLFVTDFGGRRVLTWPDVDALAACQPADGVLGAGDMAGPESVAIDVRSGIVFVSDTLDHTVKGYRRAANGTWNKVVTLGTPGVSGDQAHRFKFPRGLAVDPGGRLFVADDFNKRILIFNPPFTDGEEYSDSIGAGANGGFGSPKGLAMVGPTLFVADHDRGRVLRFTGPFTTPDQVYVASGIFSGIGSPVDVAVHGDGSLLVTDQDQRRIVRFRDAVWRASTSTPSGAFDDNLGPEPLGVAADRSGRVYLADYRRFRVLIRDEQTKKAPITAGSTGAAKSLLSNLHARAGKASNRVAIGLQLITWLYGPKSDPAAWYGDWRQLEQAGLPLPLVMGGEVGDLMSYPNFAPNQDALDELIRHGQAGNIVTLVWHPANPTQGAFGSPISTANLKKMVDDDTTVGRRWQTQLNRAAAVLEKFKSAGVPVLLRPLHEQNGNFFWWGHNGAKGAALRARQAAWVAMWRDMVTELTVRKGLDNLLFVFGTNQVNFGGVAPPLTYYPGARWADAVSIDVYDEELDLAGSARGLQHYAALISTGKPFGLAEFAQSYDENGTGPGAASWDARTLVRRIRDSYPRTVFAVSWYSSVEGGNDYVLALPDVSFTPQLLANPLIDTQ